MTQLLSPEREISGQNSAAAQLHDRLKTRKAVVAILGMGYVGLPMALEFTKAGFTTMGIDVDAERCRALAEGHSYIADITDEDVHGALKGGLFSVTADTSRLGEADVILICVPTPLRKSKDPDLTAILGAGGAVAKSLRSGQLVVLESTTYPGTTEEILLPMLEQSGLKVGEEFFLSFSPERVDPGNARFGVREITKLVGGVTSACTELSVELYSAVVTKVIPVSNSRVAEAAKLLENTFRSVNIAMANEMAVICRHLGVDVWSVIDAAATKPFGFMAHYPGPGIGGHCIPLDPHYLSWKARLSGYEPRFIALASEINGAMPHHVVDLVGEALNDSSKAIRGSKVLILGAAYKPNVSDYRESPSLEIMEELLHRGARLSYSDPFVPSLAAGETLLASQELTADLLRQQDCVVVVTNHNGFDYELIVNEAPLIVDTRNATRGIGSGNNVRFL